MITRFIVLFVVALLSLFSPATLAQNSCTDSYKLGFDVMWFFNTYFTARWYANYNCTREYRVCWNGISGSGCRNETINMHYNEKNPYMYIHYGYMYIHYPYSCSKLSLSLEAFPNPPILNDTVTATTTTVSPPEKLQSVKLSQPFGKPTVRVEWLYWVPENHCFSNFKVTWCNKLSRVCNSKSVERNASSYDIEDLEFCSQYTVTVRAEAKANNNTSAGTYIAVSVDQVRNLEVTSINSTSAVLRWAPRNVPLCTDGGEVCFIQSNLTKGEASPTCYWGLKRSDTSVIITGLQPSTSYNFTYYSSYLGSLIPPQTLEFVETPSVSGVSRTFTTYYTTVLPVSSRASCTLADSFLVIILHLAIYLFVITNYVSLDMSRMVK